jgi:CBS domain containing-hemolysin-like protein
VLRASQLVLSPLVLLSSSVAQLLLRAVGVPRGEGRPAFRREDLETAFLFGGRRREGEPSREGDRSHAEALRMAGRALVLHERTASEAMVPLDPQRTVAAGARVADAVARFREVGGRHIAVVGPDGGVEGFLAAKTLLGEPPDAPLPMRPAWSLDPDEPLDDVIQGFRRHHQSIALVRSREGRTLGIVTAEDVFEELVGELSEAGGPARPTDRR